MAERDVSFSNRLKESLELRRVSASKLSSEIGVPASSVSYYLNKGRIPEAPVLLKISQLLNVSMEWLLTGGGGFGVQADDRLETDAAYVTVTCVRGEISAGGGLVPDDTPDMRIAFRRDWIEMKGDPKKMSVIKVRGDSMEPTLLHGDLVLVNHAERHISSFGGIYAISLDHSIMVKRLAVDYAAKMIDIISDNKNYPVKPVAPDALVINGKVIWFGREIER